jgi:hypothetical protein
MRSPLSRLLALALLLSVPAGAAVVEGPLAPALGMATSVPAFRASLITQIQLASSLSAAPAPTLAPLLAPAPSAADPFRAQSARLIGALVARPAAAEAHAAELRAAVGDQGADLLLKSAARLRARAATDPALGAQLAGLREGLNPDDPASVSELSTRLNALFEGSRARGGEAAPGAAVDGRGPGKRPLVSLARPGETPAMTAQELAAYADERSVVSPRGLKRVNFESGDYRPEYDAELKRLGADLVVVKAPTRAEAARLTEKDGWYLKSEYERWVMPTRTLEEHEKSLGKAQRVRQFQNQLASSAGVPTRIGPLTVEQYERWYPIYEDEVVGKPGGKRNVGLDFARKLADKGELGKGWYGLFYYDPRDPEKMIGGVIMKAWPERGMFVLGYAAYRPEMRDHNPSVRTFAESIKLARSLGYKVFSFGQDTNFFGYDYTLGLMSNKAGFQLTPYPEDEVVLMKVLDDRKIASVTNKAGQTGGYLFFGIPRDGTLAERYFAARDEGKKPEAQELLGSDHYFTPETLAPDETTTAYRFAGDDPNPLRTPVGIKVVEGRMAAPKNGE